MSRSVDLFIASSLPIEALAEHLRARTGAQLTPTTDPARWRMVDGSVTADLYEHAYVDDGELWLSRYRYVLSTHMADGIGLLDSSEVLGLRHLAQVLHDPPHLSVLLVLDLQYRLAAGGGAAGVGAAGAGVAGVGAPSERAVGAGAGSGMGREPSAAETAAGLAAQTESRPGVGGSAEGDRA